MANKRKTTTAIVAGITALAMLLGGTFAWTSISQEAKNEAIVDINPGGRLHDDFNGTNKDVYVENFGDDKTGVPIFARIRLYEYMEIGQQAGDKDITTGKKAESLIEGDTIDDTANWEIYKYGNTESAFAKYWDWKLGNGGTAEEGGLPYYMPTFNKNKDSLAADINGTYEGSIQGDIVHYDDYTQYGADSTKTDTEVYDHDSNTGEEAEGTTEGGVPAYSTTNPDAPIDDAHVYLNENQEHKAEQISTASTVMSMAEWIALSNDEKETISCWVFDTDGWAYWSQPIEPGKTTGLLLDSITMSRVPDDNYYYGINVVGQFATASDWQMFFAPTDEGGAGEDEMTENAKAFMELITGVAVSEDGGNEDPDFVGDGTLTLRADNADTETVIVGTAINVNYDATGLDSTDPDYVAPDLSDITVTYEGSDGTVTLAKDTNYTYSYDATGGDCTLTITDTTLAGQTLTVKDANGVVSGTLTVTAESTDPENPSVETPTYYTMDVAYPLQSGTTVNLGVQDYTAESEDGIQFYIINKENNPTGGSSTELEAKDGMKVVPIVYSYAGGLMTETKYYYASSFTNGSAVTTDAAVEGITLVAMDGDTVVAYTCTKVYDATVHTYLGVGNHSYDLDGYTQNEGCLVFESVANSGTYCTLGDANIGVDGDDKFMVTTGVTAADETADYDYDVTTITETACTCTASSAEDSTT